jgi:sec-independent protein translocase protein TatB
VFNLSGSEMIFLLLIALVVLGPEKLPEAVRKFGKAYGEFKKMTTGFQSELRSALDEPMKEMRETADQLRKSANLDFNFEPDRVDGDTGHPAGTTPVSAAPMPDPATTTAATDAVATDAVVGDAVVADAITSTPAPKPVDLSAFGLGSSTGAADHVDTIDVDSTGLANSADPPATTPPVAPAPAAPTPSGWNPAPQPTTVTTTQQPAAPTPSGWSPLSSKGAGGISDDEVAPG